MTEVRIVVDSERCVGSGTCMAIAPDDFQFDDEDRSRPTTTVATDSADLRTAVDMCPTQAIALHRLEPNGAVLDRTA